jgi:hypothetical protein
MSGATAASAAQLCNPPVLQGDSNEFRRCFGVSAFVLRHSLAHHPLFSLPRLAKAAERCPSRVCVADGLTNPDACFLAMRGKRLVAGTIEDLQASSSWMKISNIGASDPDYMDLQRAVLWEAEKLSGRPIVSEVKWSDLTVFLASPKIVTPYHVDHEMNFLCQIAGEKDVCLFDPNDRELLPDHEIERFYFGQVTGLRYPEHLQSRGRTFRLTPGDAVHQPPLAAHWVKNGPQVSVSVSIAFCMRDIDRRGRIYQVNFCLRKLGLRPRPPGRFAVLDGVKAGLMGLIGLRLGEPKTYRQAVYSGPDRLKVPFRFARRLVSRRDTT